MPESNEIMVSICCLVYNHEKYLRKCLDGFIMQKTNFKYEILIHDDASTDHSADIIREYEKKYPDIIKPIYQTENQYSKGVKITWTLQFPRAKGKYIALCEGDDYWTDKNKLQEQYDYLEKHDDCSMVSHYTNMYRVEEKTVTLYTPLYLINNKDNKLFAKDIIFRHGIIHTSSLFFRKDYFYKHSFFLDQIRTYDYVYKMILCCEGYIYIIPKVMSVYRYGTPNSWSEKNGKSINKQISVINEQIFFLRKLNEYTGKKNEKLINERIRINRFEVYKLRLDYNKMKSKDYYDLYKTMPVMEKCVLRLKWFSPKLYDYFYKHFRPIIRKIYKKRGFGR